MKALLIVHGITLGVLFVAAMTLSIIEDPAMHVVWAVFWITSLVAFLQWVAVAIVSDAK